MLVAIGLVSDQSQFFEEKYFKTGAFYIPFKRHHVVDSVHIS